MSSEGHNYVRMFALDHAPGIYRVRCPACNGGNSGERSMNITLVHPDGAKWKCHRASCTERGAMGIEHIRTAPLSWENNRAASKVKPYLGDIYLPSHADTEYFRDRFNVDPAVTLSCIRRTVPSSNIVGAYVFPIFNIWGALRGHVVRQPKWAGAPAPLEAEPGEVKAKTWPLSPEPMQSWYFPAGDDMVNWVIIVEDQVSAMAVASAGFIGLALLGTHLNIDRVREIQRVNPDSTVLALDNDAEGQALRLAQKWGMTLPGFRVHLLHEDLKDSPDVYEELTG